MPFDYNFRI